jgi:hypothetical protein
MVDRKGPGCHWARILIDKPVWDLKGGSTLLDSRGEEKPPIKNPMEAAPRHNPLPRAVALILITLCVARLYQNYTAHALRKIDSMSPSAYVEYHRTLYEHTYLFNFLLLLVYGGFFLGAVEIVAFLIRALMPKGARE